MFFLLRDCLELIACKLACHSSVLLSLGMMKPSFSWFFCIRLKDSVSQNQQLAEELKGTKRVYEVLQQRHEEEKTMSSPDSKVK